jgi:hypothetical protein
VRALFAARYFLSAPTLWDGFEQILTNLTNKIFPVLFAGEGAGVFREKVHRTKEKFFCPAKGPLGRDMFF